jgi:hypothetical protein
MDHQLPPRPFQPDPNVRLARVQLGQRVALGRVALPHDLAQLVRAEPLRQRGEPTARLDARELARIPDGDHLYVLGMRGGKHAGADPGRSHAGLVDQHHRPSRAQPLAMAQILGESMEGARGHARAAGQLARRPSRRRRPHHPIARPRIDRGQRPRHRRLARARQRLDDVHRVSARRDRPYHGRLLVAQRCGQRREGTVNELSRHGSRTGALAAHGVDDDPSLARQQTGGGVPPRTERVRDRHDVVARQEPVGRPLDLAGRRAVGMSGGQLGHRVTRFEAIALRRQPLGPGQERSHPVEVDP